MEQFVDSPPPLSEIVRNILLTAWDPIRIQELPEKYRLAAADEYDEYVATIVKMINERSEQRAFERYLLFIETRTMGQRAGNSRAPTAAQALFDLQASVAGDR